MTSPACGCDPPKSGPLSARTPSSSFSADTRAASFSGASLLPSGALKNCTNAGNTFEALHGCITNGESSFAKKPAKKLGSECVRFWNAFCLAKGRLWVLAIQVIYDLCRVCEPLVVINLQNGHRSLLTDFKQPADQRHRTSHRPSATLQPYQAIRSCRGPIPLWFVVEADVVLLIGHVLLLQRQQHPMAERACHGASWSSFTSSENHRLSTTQQHNKRNLES